MNLQKGKHTPGTHSTQQPRGQFNNSRVQASVPQVSRSDDYRRQGPGYSQQTVPNPAGLYVSPTGGVGGGPVPQQAPPPPQAVAMPGAATGHPSAQGAAAASQNVVVSAQMQQSRNPPNLYYRPSNVQVRPFHNLSWQPHNPMNVANTAQQVNASTFQTTVPSSIAYQLQQNYLQQGPTIMRNTPTVVNMPTYQFPSTCPTTPTQYNLQAGQQIFLPPQSGSYPYNQRQVYYGQLPQMQPVMAMQQSNRNTVQNLPPQQAPQQPPPVVAPKRERKILRIQHPDTLEDINIKGKEEMGDQAAPDLSLIKEGSQMDTISTELTDTRIQFAQQVAAVAIPGPARKDAPKQERLVPQPGPPHLPILPVVMGVPPGIMVPPPVPTDMLMDCSDRTPMGMGIDPQAEIDPQDQMGEEVSAYELGAPITMPPHEIMLGPDAHVIDALQDEEVYSTEECLEEAQFEVDPVSSEEEYNVKAPCEDFDEPIARTISPVLDQEPMAAPQPMASAPPAATPVAAPPCVGILPVPAVAATPAVTPVATPYSGVLPVAVVAPERFASLDAAVPPPVPASSPPRETLTPERDEEEAVVVAPPVVEKKIEISAKPQQNGDLGSPPFLDEKDSSEGRDNKKKAKKKLRDLNKKGKEGSEMDAFVVDREEEVSVLPPVATKVVLLSPDREADEEESRKVAEKNQENTRVSGQDDDGVPATPVIEPPPAAKPQDGQYSYKEDQWSPLNPEGKKHYDRAFLLKMQSQPMSLKKPRGLPNLEVIKDIAMQYKLPEHGNRPAQPPMQTPHRGNQPDFMPSYARGGTPRPPQGGGGGGGSMNRRQSQQGRDSKPKKIINISTSFNEDVKLHSSENAWKPGTKAPVETDVLEEEDKTQDLYKKVRGILNKLTPQKFQTLVEQVRDMPIDTEERLKGVIDLVFEKAVDEPNFSVPYANMCKHLAMKAVPSGQNNQNVNFRKLLLTKCQKEFESDTREELRRQQKLKDISSADVDKRKQMTEELEDELRKSRRRSLGNIKFIGELYKLNMLVTPIMHDCLSKLLKAEDEDSLECLCRLLSTVGKELETDKKPEASEKGKAHAKQIMDSYFEGMKKVIDNRHTTSRVRFMIQDVIELRLNNWIPRRIENNPKTIDQIHKEAEQEAHEQHLMVQQPLPSSANKRPDDRDRRKNRSMQGGGYEEPGWNTVGGNKSRGSAAFNYDPSKGTPKLVSKPLETDSIQLGPSTRAWNRGSSGGGSRPANQDGESKSNTVAINRFQALATQDSEPRRSLHQSSSSSREPSRGRGSQGGGGPPMTIRKTPSQNSQTPSEREKMTAAVKAFFDPGALDVPGLPPSGGRQVAPEPTRNDTHKESPVIPFVVPSSATVPAAKLEGPAKNATGEFLLKGHDLDEELLQKKATPILDEYLHNDDLKEATQCIVELVSPGCVPLFVMICINHVLERSPKARLSLGHLLRELLCKNIINVQQCLQGLSLIFETVMDLEIDIPKVWQYLGEILYPLVEGGLPLGAMVKAADACIKQDCGGKLFKQLLLVMAHHSGPVKVKELWLMSGVQWTDVLPPREDVQKFVLDNKLEFTLAEVVPAQAEGLTIEQIKDGLDALLRRRATNEDIFDWIHAKVGQERLTHPNFIRALVTAVTESAIEGYTPEGADLGKIKDRIILLQRFIDSKEPLELQALYALQALDFRLQHPQNMLAPIFEVLYDEDVISEDAFIHWGKSSDPAEEEGKGVALKSVTSFFTWLQEAEDESVDEN